MESAIFYYGKRNKKIFKEKNWTKASTGEEEIARVQKWKEAEETKTRRKESSNSAEASRKREKIFFEIKAPFREKKFG